MYLTKSDFHLACDCGRAHTMQLERAVIAQGALAVLDEALAGTGLLGEVVAVYDQNTYDATSGLHPKVAREIVLEADNLHADEAAVATVTGQMKNADVLVAIGSGTIHDITRYCASQRCIPFASVPTAASVDGFVSTVAAMSFNGFKVTVPATPPRIVVADLNIVAKAPWNLTCAGVGDVLGKYTSLADWKIGHALTGEAYCGGIEALTRQAADQVVATYKGLENGNMAAYESLMCALVLSGVAIQFYGSSRPASGSEHHISHLLELGVPRFRVSSAYHGEKVGVGTVMCATEYHRLAQSVPVFPRVFREPSVSTYTEVFGKVAAEAMKENENDCLRVLSPVVLEEKWNRVAELVAEIPPAETIERILRDMGAKYRPGDIDIPGGEVENALFWSPYVRNRLTLMRIRHGLLADG